MPDESYIIHRDKPDCDCGRCEPAEGGNMMGALMSGNPGCDFPNCIVLGITCRWGDGLCGDLEDDAVRVARTGGITGQELADGSR